MASSWIYGHLVLLKLIQIKFNRVDIIPLDVVNWCSGCHRLHAGLLLHLVTVYVQRQKRENQNTKIAFELQETQMGENTI